MEPIFGGLSGTLFTFLLGSLFILWRVNLFVRNRNDNPRGLPLPPGPNGYPIIGNLINFPLVQAWLVYDDWFRIYGDMIYLNVLGQPFLVLGTHERTYDLFEKRSSNYSDRARMPMLFELMGWEFNLALIPYGTWWRRSRRTFHDHFHPNIVHKYQHVQLNAARVLLGHLLESPDKFWEHTRLTFASTIMKVAYGITVQEHDDPYVKMIEEVIALGSAAARPGASLVDLIPSMKYIPSWLPGAGWKRTAEYANKLTSIIVRKPFETVQEELKAGTAMPSVAASVIDNLPGKGAPNYAEEEAIAKHTCAVAYAGGADTSAAAVHVFFMAMALYPEAQKKAQVELDNVLKGRLPEFNDRPNLPFVNAVLKETMRWLPVAPLAVPHMSSAPDEYNGYYIPKGTMIIGNAWTILHDPEVYPDPYTFKPERYIKKEDGQLNPAVPDPNIAAFGFGRRICPGRFFSDNSLFAVISHVLTTFDIRLELDEYGREITINTETTDGTIVHPIPFKCRITPRSNMAEELIRNSELLD